MLSVRSAPTGSLLRSVPLVLFRAGVQCSIFGWQALHMGLHMDSDQSNWILDKSPSKTPRTDTLPPEIWRDRHISMHLIIHTLNCKVALGSVYDCQTPEHWRSQQKKICSADSTRNEQSVLGRPCEISCTLDPWEDGCQTERWTFNALSWNTVTLDLTPLRFSLWKHA